MVLERRPATPADIPFLMQLRFDTMGPHLVAAGADSSEEHHRKRMLYRFELGQVLLEGGKPVGLLKLARDPKEWEVVQIQLAPELQGRGLGRRLLEEFLAEAKAAGKDVVLNVLRKSPAKKLYERLGFRVEREDEFRHYMRVRP